MAQYFRVCLLEGRLGGGGRGQWRGGGGGRGENKNHQSFITLPLFVTGSDERRALWVDGNAKSPCVCVHCCESPYSQFSWLEGCFIHPSSLFIACFVSSVAAVWDGEWNDAREQSCIEIFSCSVFDIVNSAWYWNIKSVSWVSDSVSTCCNGWFFNLFFNRLYWYWMCEDAVLCAWLILNLWHVKNDC